MGPPALCCRLHYLTPRHPHVPHKTIDDWVHGAFFGQDGEDPYVYTPFHFVQVCPPAPPPAKGAVPHCHVMSLA